METCGVFTSDGFEGSGTGWTCGRPQGHPHDGARYGKVTAGNHARAPLPQDTISACGEDGCWTFPHNHPSEV